MPTTSALSLNTLERFNTEDELENTAQTPEESML